MKLSTRIKKYVAPELMGYENDGETVGRKIVFCINGHSTSLDTNSLRLADMAHKYLLRMGCEFDANNSPVINGLNECVFHYNYDGAISDFRDACPAFARLYWIEFDDEKENKHIEGWASWRLDGLKDTAYRWWNQVQRLGNADHTMISILSCNVLTDYIVCECALNELKEKNERSAYYVLSLGKESEVD